MRNLKRVLSLALASAMLFGMMVIGAAAADKKPLTDLDKVTNKEAVSLMVDLGIIVGKPDGSYAPTETVDRATMSKLIYFILMGTADESAFKGVSTPLTDVKGNWAEGFINYCYSMNIVAGTGNNTFNPNGKVTTASAAKMLLVALGYDAKMSKYENDAMWSVNIMRDAQKAGLLNNMSQKASEDLSRDNAAQMIYNALFATTVEPTFQMDMGVKYLSGYKSNLTTLGEDAYGLKKVEGVATSAASSKLVIGGTTYDVAGSPDVVGKKVTIYTKNGISITGNTVGYTYKSTYSSAPVVSAKVLGVSHSGTAFGNLTTATDSKFIAEPDTNLAAVSYYVNGMPESQVNAASANLRGNVVTLLDNNNNGKVDTITVDKYVVVKVSTYSTKDNGSITFSAGGTVDGLTGPFTSKNVVGFDKVAKDDIVTAVAYDGKLYLTETTSVEGKVTKITSGANPSYTVDGVDYKGSLSQLAGTPAINLGDTKVFFLDKNNYIVAVENVASVSDPYAYVAAVASVSAFGGQQVKLVFTDGTAKVVNVTKRGVNGASATDVAGLNVAAVGEIVTYTEKNGNYELNVKANKTTEMGTTTITKGNATVDSGVYADGATVYVDVANGKAYTGYANVPTMTATTAGAAKAGYYAVSDSNAALAKVVFLTNITSTSAVASDKFVIFDTSYSMSKDADNATIYTYKAIVKGEITTVQTNASVQSTIGSTTGIYTASNKNPDGVITGLTGGATALSTAVNVRFVSGNLIVHAPVAGSSSITVNDDTVVFVIDTGDKTAEVGSIGSINVVATGNAGNDDIIVVPMAAPNAHIAQYVYIIRA